MKKFFKILLILLSILNLFIFGCSEKVSINKPVRISINIWPGYAFAFIAKEKGFFKKNNVDVELVLETSILDSLKLFKNGDVDGCFDVFPDIVMTNLEGISAKVVYIADYSISGDVIVGKPDIRSLSDLKGKKVSFVGVDTFSNIFVFDAISRVGLMEYDLNFANIKAHDVLEALETGMIDAGHTWEPTLSKALNKGYKVLANASDCPGIIIDVLAFKKEFIEKRPEDVNAVIKSLIQARNYLENNKEESLKIMASCLNITQEEVNMGINGVFLPDLEENIKLMSFTEVKGSISLIESTKIIMDYYINRGQALTLIRPDEIICNKFISGLKKIK